MKKNNRPGFWERMAIVPHTVWVILFIAAPLLFVVYYAFTDKNGSFTLDNIASLSFYGETFLMSISFSLIATVVCLLIGYPLAYFMSKTKPKTQMALMLLIMLPVGEPAYKDIFSHGAFG